MSKEVYNMIKLCGLAGVLYSPNAECVCRLYSHYNWYRKRGQVNRTKRNQMKSGPIVSTAWVTNNHKQHLTMNDL
ncbi:MAG TPA: hypothetical protein VIJ25_15940, partial [Methylococcales bacterium]